MRAWLRLPFLPLSCAALLVAATSARADCVDGTRQPAAGEVDFLQRARAAMVAALPEAVRPIERSSPNRPDPTAGVPLAPCRNTPVGAFDVAVNDGFMYRFSPEEANARSQQRRALQRQVEELEKLPPDKEAQRRELESQMRAAYAAAPTRSRRDPPFTPEQQAQVDRAQAEGRRLEDAMRRIEAEHRASVKPQTDPLRARADEFQQGPQIFTVTLGMNVKSFGDPLPADRGERITFGVLSPRQSASLQPVNVVVAVIGPVGPARDALVSLIDRDYLAGLLGKPLPEVGASVKRIESNVARAAVTPTLSVASSVPAGAAAGATVTAPGPALGTSSAASTRALSSEGAAPLASADSAAAGATARAAPPTSANAPNPCPPPTRSTTASDDGQRTGSQVGAEVGGAALGGGWGRGIGSAVGGALGALGGNKPRQQPQQPADCPR